MVMADPFTTFEQVAFGYQPPIPSSDEDTIDDLIDEAELELRSRLGDLQAWIDAKGPSQVEDRTKTLQRVTVRMVRRVLRNPQGFIGEADGDYSYTRDRSLRSGQIYVSEADRRLLGLRTRRARSLRLGLPAGSPRNMHLGS